MTLRGLSSSLFCLIAAFTGSTHAGLVCTSGNVVGLGSCQESVTLGQTVTTEFSNQPLSFDLWQSNAEPNFVETLVGVRFTFGGTVHYDAILKNFALSTKAGGMVIDEIFDFSRGSGPTSFLTSDVKTTGLSGLSYALSAGQAIPIQIDATLPSLAVVNTFGLDEYTGSGTFEAFVSGSTGYTFTGNAASYTDVILQYKNGGSYGTALPMATVTYDFVTTASPVPEPASWALVTTALVIGTVLRRRRVDREGAVAERVDRSVVFSRSVACGEDRQLSGEGTLVGGPRFAAGDTGGEVRIFVQQT